MGTHLRVLSESFPMNTNMTGFRCFSHFFLFLRSCALEESSLSIGRVISVLSDLVLILRFSFSHHECLNDHTPGLAQS